MRRDADNREPIVADALRDLDQPLKADRFGDEGTLVRYEETRVSAEVIEASRQVSYEAGYEVSQPIDASQLRG